MKQINETSNNNFEIMTLTFYRDWHELVVKNNLSNEQYGKLVRAMCDYCFYNKDTELDDKEGIIFGMSKPSIRKSSERKTTGHKGGSKGGGGAPLRNKNATKKKV